MGAPGLVTPFKAWVGTLPRRRLPPCMSTGESIPTCIQHAWSMHCTDWQVRLPNKIMSLKKERLIKKREIIHFLWLIIIFFQVQWTMQTFVMLCFAFLCNMTEFQLFDFSFHICAILQVLLLRLGTDKLMCSLMRNVLLCDQISGWKTIKFSLIHGYF